MTREMRCFSFVACFLQRAFPPFTSSRRPTFAASNTSDDDASQSCKRIPASLRSVTQIFLPNPSKNRRAAGKEEHKRLHLAAAVGTLYALVVVC